MPARQPIRLMLPLVVPLWVCLGIATAVSPAAENQPPEGFVALFDGVSFAGWKYPPSFAGHWVVRDGVIACDGKVEAKRGQDRNLWTEKEYGDFVLLADWRLPARPERKPMNVFSPDGLIVRDEKGQAKKHDMPFAGDSGIYLRGNGRSQVNIWSQPMGSGDINDYHKDLKLPPEIRRACVPSKNADKPFGQWNRFVITMIKDRVTLVLNGETVIDKAQLPDVPPRGALALQNHGDPVEFRNLFLKDLSQHHSGGIPRSGDSDAANGSEIGSKKLR